MWNRLRSLNTWSLNIFQRWARNNSTTPLSFSAWPHSTTRNTFAAFGFISIICFCFTSVCDFQHGLEIKLSSLQLKNRILTLFFLFHPEDVTLQALIDLCKSKWLWRYLCSWDYVESSLKPTDSQSLQSMQSACQSILDGSWAICTRSMEGLLLVLIVCLFAERDEVYCRNEAVESFAQVVDRLFFFPLQQKRTRLTFNPYLETRC